MQSFLKFKNLTNLKIVACAAFFAAISIVFGKFLAFNVGETLRFSFESLPIILCGIAYGPTVAALTGLVADLVGCLLRGYAINPIITLACLLIGFLAGVLSFVLRHTNKSLMLFITVFVCHIIGSIIIKTIGLHLVLGYPFFITLIQRTINYLVVATVEYMALVSLFRNKPFLRTIGVKYEL